MQTIPSSPSSWLWRRLDSECLFKYRSCSRTAFPADDNDPSGGAADLAPIRDLSLINCPQRVAADVSQRVFIRYDHRDRVERDRNGVRDVVLLRQSAGARRQIGASFAERRQPLLCTAELNLDRYRALFCQCAQGLSHAGGADDAKRLLPARAGDQK